MKTYYRKLQGLALAVVCWAVGAAASGKTKDVTYSFQALALAPNADGQEAYALRRATDDVEWSLFLNNYLTAGDKPLVGATYNLRFPICDQSCFWQFYFQAGAGISTAGPTVELLWGTNLLWLFRLDVATQLFLTTDRMILWSYPLWVGLSIPL